jgi:hypothetical protein
VLHAKAASRCRVTAAYLEGRSTTTRLKRGPPGLDPSAADFGVLYGAVDSDS